ncbi:MAG: ATP-binding protein [Phormidesmis sp.]
MSSLSLQTHLVSAQPQLPAISVDPRGFKIALRSLINFLIANQVSATLWLKLPKDDAWWTDIWRYGQQAPDCNIYVLGGQPVTLPEELAANLQVIAIAQDADLKREYLCLAIADNFVGVLLAARAPVGTHAADKRTLKLYCSTSNQGVTALSAGIKQAIEGSLPVTQAAAELTDISSESDISAEGNSSASSDLPDRNQAAVTEDPFAASRAVLNHWEHYFPNDPTLWGTLPLTDAFLAWQLQSQEELRSQLATYRSVGQGATTAPLFALAPDFLAQAGQELQSPLTTIKTALTLLGSPTLKLAQRQRYLDMIGAQCEHQKSLINSVIDLLQIQTSAASTPKALQLADMIPGIVSTYQPIAEEEGIMLAYTVPANLTKVMGTEAGLKKAVTHLIINGIQNTLHGGRVWVTAAPHDANFVALTVQDSGVGIAKTDIAKLFEAFYRSSSNHKAGAGLGLTLVQQLIGRMGGSVSVDSELSRGTTFKLLLPIDSAASVGTHSSSVRQAIADDAMGSSQSLSANPDLSSTFASVSPSAM